MTICQNIEFQEYAKRLGLTGNKLIKKYVLEGKLPNPVVVEEILYV